MNIEAFRYFGSFVRGESDDLSDCDILIVGAKWSEREENRLLGLIPSNLSIIASISWYSPKKIREMFTAGDLFAWHLHLESLKVNNSTSYDLIDYLGVPSEYTHAKETYSTFLTLFLSIEVQLHSEYCSLTYEAGLLYVSVRNIAMALSWYTPGGLCFSRYSPTRISEQIGITFPLSVSEFQSLVQCRLASQRGVSTSAPSRDNLLRQWTLLRNWIDDIWNKLFGAEHIPAAG